MRRKCTTFNKEIFNGIPPGGRDKKEHQINIEGWVTS